MSRLSQTEKNARLLKTDHLMSDLGRRTSRGGVIAIVGQGVRQLIQIINFAIMSRLLAPADFGLVAMALAVTAFASMFTDLGLSTATIQRKNIDQNTTSILYYLNVGIGIVLMVLVCLVSPIAAWFFGDGRVLWLIVALSVTLPLGAAAAQHAALLARGMQWSRMQSTMIASQLLGFLMGVLLAATTNLGYWALVATAWGSSLSYLLLVRMACPWRPTGARSWSGARSAIQFGLNLTGFNVVNFLHRQLDNVLIGWRWGPTDLGYYSRAYGLLTVPLALVSGPVSSAIIPALSRLQADPERWRGSLVEALSAVIVVSSGVAAVLIVASELVVTLVLGPGWSKSADIFFYLAISMLAATPMNAMGWIYVSLGRTRRMFAWSLIQAPIIIAAFWVGLPAGATGVALCYSVAVCLLAIPCMAFAAHNTPIRVSYLIRVAAPPTCVAIVAIIGGIAISDPHKGMLSAGHPILAVLLTGAIYACGAALVIKFDPFYVSLPRRLRAFVSPRL